MNSVVKFGEKIGDFIIAEIFGDNKAADFFSEFSDRIHPNLAIFLLMFIKLSLFSLFFFSHASTCSPLLTCNTRREGRANVQALPSSRRDPWETVKFESCGGAKTLTRPSLRVLQVSSGEQVDACDKKQREQRQFDENQQTYG